MARSKPEPGRMVKTSVPGIYKRTSTKGETTYIVRVFNPRKGPNGGRDDYRATSFEAAKQIKRDKEGIRRRNTGLIYTVREWMGDPSRGVDGRWLELFPRPKESTTLHNRERVAEFVRRHGDLTLDRVTAEQALEFHQAYAARTMVVRAAFNDAVKARQIEENPFAAVEVKKGRGRRDIVVLTDKELAKLLATAERVHGDFGREVFAPMLAVAAGTGCRPGENFALRAEDIDLENQSVHIWRQWNSRLRKFTTLKGTRLDRHVEMLPVAVRALERMEMPGSGTIWRTVRDKPFKARELTYYWPAVRDSFVAGLPDSHHLQRRLRKEVQGGKFDPYELRHMFGTALARANCSIFEIEDQMGHHGSETVRTYVHLANEDVRVSVREKLRRAA